MKNRKIIVALQNNQVVQIFEQSKVNGCQYKEPEEIMVKWNWPKSTWMKKRLQEINNLNYAPIA